MYKGFALGYRASYRLGKQLLLTEGNGNIVLTDPESGQVTATHRIHPGRGRLIQNNNHLRDRTNRISGLYTQVLDLLENTPEAILLLNMIKQEKPRYVRDQFLLIRTTVNNYGAEVIREAAKYCADNELWSAVDFRSAAEHFALNKADDASAADAAGHTCRTRIESSQNHGILKIMRQYTEVANNVRIR